MSDYVIELNYEWI